MLLDIFHIILGIVLLIKGGNVLVDSAVDIARHARLSGMVIGLTVVGFGTSMPELLVSASSAWVGSSGLAIGNVVGSNIANIALILGLTALVRPLSADKGLLAVDMPFMLCTVVAFVLVAVLADGISRLAGVTDVLILVAFVAWQVRKSRSQAQHYEAPAHGLVRNVLMLLVAFGVMVYGANRLVDAASHIAATLGVEDRIIGLTIVGVGTSLPEMFATIIAAHKGETDMAIGNIIGSVTFNILSVIGVSAAITPILGVRQGFLVDYGLMVLLGLLLWFFLFTHRKLERWEGGVLLAVYVAYLVTLCVA